MKGKQVKPPTPEVNPSAVVAVEIERITPSRFETQSRRRQRFKPEEIESLGDSILTLGMFQPILVRPAFPDFEIVFGERRFLASKSKNLKTIDCFIRELSDAEVLELQYEENHRRQENNPLDDAFLFKFLQEKQGFSEDQIADRLNTTRRNVVDKLKLNDLIPQAAAELESGALPLKHAVYLAKFPEATQNEICRSNLAYKYNDSSEKAVSFDEFRSEVEENILRRLKSAPFNIGDPRLHIKQLICVNCPEQTGAQNYLFPDHAGRDARCLNPGCYQLKTDTHLKLERAAIALESRQDAIQSSDDLKTATAAVPLVTTNSYAPERSPFGKEKVLTSVQPLPEPECEFSELGLAIGGEMKGKQVYLCREKHCPVHDPQPKIELTAAQVKALEEDFNEEVSRLAYQKILKEAVNYFDDYKSFWTFDDLIKKLLTVCLEHARWEDEDAILAVINDWNNSPKNLRSEQKNIEFVSGLDKRRQSQLLFVFITLGMDYGDEAKLRKFAADFTKLDYDALAEDIREQLK